MRLLLSLVVCGFAAPLAAQPFAILTPPPDATGSMTTYAVSADGAVVVGSYGVSGQSRAFRWADGVAVRLVDEGAPFQAERAAGISADGAVIVGFGESADGEEAFRWTAAGGVERLGTLPGGSASNATGVSADGTAVVGFDRIGSATRAFVWTAAEGMEDLGVLPAPVNGDCGANAVSADGGVVVGACTRFIAGSGTQSEAFRWTRAGGIEGLGDIDEPSGRLDSGASAVSADGSVIVGSGGSPSTRAQVRWVAGGLPEALPYGFDYTGRAGATTVSADGRVVGGFDFETSSLPVAVLWSEASGPVPVRDAADVPAETLLQQVDALSADGSVAVGIGFGDTGGTFAWRAGVSLATADEPGAAPAALSLTAAPNPASASATVGLTLAAPGAAQVAVFDALGRRVAVLHEGPLAAGMHQFALGAAAWAPGVYLVRATTPEAVATTAVTVAR